MTRFKRLFDSETAVLSGLFFASGMAALIYEVVWFSLLRLVIGGSAISLGFLLAGYMGGLCLGSLAYARFAPQGSRPLRHYALMELGIGVFGLLIPIALPALSSLWNIDCVSGR
jgi:spermidine synthase